MDTWSSPDSMAQLFDTIPDEVTAHILLVGSAKHVLLVCWLWLNLARDLLRTPASLVVATPALAAFYVGLDPACRYWACRASARDGRLETLRWAHDNGCPWDKWTCAWAASRGHLEVLRWARSQGCPWDVSTSTGATLGGHLEVLRWARENGCPWDPSAVRELTTSGNHSHVLAWLDEQPQPRT